MIVYQIDSASIWAGESKDHAPVAGHGDCSIAGKVAHQGMQVEARFVHIHVIPGLLQTSQDEVNFIGVLGRYPPALVLFIETPETIVPEIDDHQ